VSELAEVLSAWDFVGDARVDPLTSGLINQSFAVSVDATPVAVVQRVNTDVFSPLVHYDIEAVTARLAQAGLPTPRLIRTRSGSLWHTDASGGVWRALTPVGDRTVERVTSPAQAASAAALVARVHDALADFDWAFQSVRVGAQDTERHLANLAVALREHVDHPLHSQVAPLADWLMERWERAERVGELPSRVIHGDLKISNVRFAGERAHALIDLDTFARSTLEVELGDALRSWCNTSSEADPASRFDAEIAEAALRAYAAASTSLRAGEVEAVLSGVARITLNLVARFAADALQERYFGWDAARYSSRGAHNLARATGQAALLRSVDEQVPALRARVRS